MQFPRLALSVGAMDALRPLTPLAELVSTAESDRPEIANPRLDCKNRNGMGKCNGTESEPQIVIEGALHESDRSGAAPEDVNATYPPQVVKDAHMREAVTVKAWLEEWKNQLTEQE